MGPLTGIAAWIQSLLQDKKQRDPVANHERNFGMTGGELGPRSGHPGYGQSYRPNPNYIPPGSSPSMNMDWSKVRASQRPGYVPDINPYDLVGVRGGGQKVAGKLDLGLPEEFQTKLEEQALTGFPSIQSQDATSGEADAVANQAAISSQNTQGLGYDYTNEGLGNVGHDYTNEGYAAGWQTPSAAIGGVAGPGDYAGEIKDFDISTAQWVGTPRAPTTEYSTHVPTATFSAAHPNMSGILPTLGMRRPETSFDANIEVGGRPGGWFTPGEYGRNYYKFGRGA